MLRKTLALAGLAIGGLWAPAGFAQDIVIPNIIELSGGGATVGAMWKNGSSMAVEEINAKGGILGTEDRARVLRHRRPTPAWPAPPMQKALDDEPYVVFGPIYLRLRQRHHADAAAGRDAAVYRRRGRPS